MFLIAGVGNTLREDDGIGVVVVELLEEDNDISGVHYLDAGINSFRLLDVIKKYDKTIIIDAVNFSDKIGDVKLLNPEDFLNSSENTSLSMHCFNLVEFFKLAKFEEQLDEKIYLIGIQPFKTEFEIDLTSEIKNQLSTIVNEVKKIIKKILEKK